MKLLIKQNLKIAKNSFKILDRAQKNLKKTLKKNNCKIMMIFFLS